MPNEIQNPNIKYLSFDLCHSILIWTLAGVFHRKPPCGRDQATQTMKSNLITGKRLALRAGSIKFDIYSLPILPSTKPKESTSGDRDL